MTIVQKYFITEHFTDMLYKKNFTKTLVQPANKISLLLQNCIGYKYACTF